MKLLKVAGATSEIWQLFVSDSSSTTGAGLTGLTSSSAGLTAYYHRDTDTTASVISLVGMTVGTYTSGGFAVVDGTNMPGWYQFCPPNAALASGAKSCAFHLKGASNMAPLPIECQLSAVNPDSATAFVTSVALASGQKVDVDTIKTNPVVNGGTITFPSNATLASTTNITGGTVDRAITSGTVSTVLSLTANADKTGYALASGQKVDVDTIKTNPVVNAGTITFPANATLASTTNITAGTVDRATTSGTVSTVLSLTANADKTGYALTAAYDPAKTASQAGDAMTLTAAYDFAKGTAAMAESYAANTVTPTPIQALYAIHQILSSFAISGTSNTVKKLDNATTAFVATLDDATNPTSAVRS